MKRDTIYHGSLDHKDDIHRTPDVMHIRNPDVAHEVSDVSVRPIAQFVAGLFFFGITICVLMLLLFGYFERRAVENELKPSPVARQGDERLPPEPRLQSAPGWGVTTDDNRRIDLSLKEPQAEMRVALRQWEQKLTTYGWADQSSGRVRIPIDEAKKRFLQSEAARAGQQQQQQQPGGIPSQAAEDADGPQIPSASSSGQKTEERDQ